MPCMYTIYTYIYIHIYIQHICAYSFIHVIITYTHTYAHNAGITENFKPFKKFTKEELQFGFKVSSVFPPHNSDLINL